MSCEIKVNFELLKTTTWGITSDNKTDGFLVPVVIRETEVLESINELVKEHETKNPLYGNNPEYKTLYLKCDKLSEKQTKELFNKGRQNILIHFQVVDVFTTKTGTKYLNFKIMKLRKVDRQTECPED